MTTPAKERILRDNRRISIQVEQWINSAMALWGLTAAQVQVLLYVLGHSNQGTSLTQIHREYGYSMAALSCIVKRLREKGYIRVEPWAGDERRKLLFAIQAAQELQHHLDRSTQRLHQQLYRGFTPQELCDLDRLQRKLLNSLSALTHPAKEEPSP